MKKQPAINDLLQVMAKLRSAKGCPWDREQTHLSLRRHAIEEVYELVDAIEAGDDSEMAEELGDLLLQVVFHAQMARERGAFDFEQITRTLVNKLIRRHPHVFSTTKVKNVDEVWANWEKIKKAEKQGTKHERPSALDGIPKHLPALLRAEKLARKAGKAGLIPPQETDGLPGKNAGRHGKNVKKAIAQNLFDLARFAHDLGWSAEELLSAENKRREREWRRRERIQARFKRGKV